MLIFHLLTAALSAMSFVGILCLFLDALHPDFALPQLLSWQYVIKYDKIQVMCETFSTVTTSQMLRSDLLLLFIS
jgi:hypothetical protein